MSTASSRIRRHRMRQSLSAWKIITNHMPDWNFFIQGLFHLTAGTEPGSVGTIFTIRDGMWYILNKDEKVSAAPCAGELKLYAKP